MDQTNLSPLARALGRVPTGLYIVSVAADTGPVGFVGSFVTQVGIEPPMLSVAVGKARGPLAAIRAAGYFGISILDTDSKWVMKHFFNKLEPGASPFDGLELVQASGGTPVLAKALAWVECKIQGEHETGDHVVVYGTAVDGALVREGEPSVHLRRNGLGY